MFVLDIKSLVKSKVTVVIFTLVGIVILLSIIIYTLSMKLNILRGTLISDIIGKIGEKDNILNMKSYYTEMEVTIVSNKNTNTYIIKEWHKKGIGSRMEYLDSSNSKVIIVITNNRTIIQNEDQKSTIYIDPNIIKHTNLLSIATFIDIYNEGNNKQECFSSNSYEKVNNINMIIDNVCKNKESCKGEYMEIVKNTSKIELKLDKNSGKPLTYIVYDNDKRECISIVYNKFDINSEIKGSLFKI